MHNVTECAFAQRVESSATLPGLASVVRSSKRAARATLKYQCNDYDTPKESLIEKPRLGGCDRLGHRCRLVGLVMNKELRRFRVFVGRLQRRWSAAHG